MYKSELVMNKLNQAETLLQRVVSLVEQVAQLDENGDGCSVGKFMTAADEMANLLDELGYEIAMPMQVEEDEREEEIATLEARLAELRAQ
jgi:hypothetical protein